MTTAERLKKQGREEAKLEDARRMFEEGLDDELIVRISGLSRQEALKLKDSKR